MAVVLTQEEADELLEMLKKCVQQSFSLPKKGEKDDLEIQGINDRSKFFIISVNRANKTANKVSFTARYKKGDVRLLRLDVAPTAPHRNLEEFGGEKIVGTHLHIYKEGFEDKYAIPFDIDDPDLYKYFLIFLDEFNVVERCKIEFQTDLKEV